MMMGTAGEVVIDAKPTIKFIEDMTEAEIAKEVIIHQHFFDLSLVLFLSSPFLSFFI